MNYKKGARHTASGLRLEAEENFGVKSQLNKNKSNLTPMEWGEKIPSRLNRLRPREIRAKKISQGKRLTGQVGQAG